MATRGWGTSVALAVGVAAGLSAAQLGLGYGLGVIAWTASKDTTGDSSWLASLAWTTWIAATCTVVGAIVADRLSAGGGGTAPPRQRTVDGVSRRIDPGALATGAWRLAITLAAAIGGLLTVPLVAIPARATHRVETSVPQLIAGGYAIVGVLVGVVVAIMALSSRAIAANVLATAGWLWLLAIAAVANGVATGHHISTAQLAVWRFGPGHFLRSTFSVPGAAMMMGAALLIGALAGWPADRRGDNRIGVAISGAFGPVLVAAAYFLATPKLVGVQADEQLSAFLVAPYAVLAGLTGSVGLSALRAQREQQRARRAAGAARLDQDVIATLRGAPPAEVPAQPPAPLDRDLADDGYAPGSAYRDGGGEPGQVMAGATSSGSTDPKLPLWPEQATGGTGTATDTKRGRSKRR